MVFLSSLVVLSWCCGFSFFFFFFLILVFVVFLSFLVFLSWFMVGLDLIIGFLGFDFSYTGVLHTGTAPYTPRVVCP